MTLPTVILSVRRGGEESRSWDVKTYTLKLVIDPSTSLRFAQDDTTHCHFDVRRGEGGLPPEAQRRVESRSRGCKAYILKLVLDPSYLGMTARFVISNVA